MDDSRKKRAADASQLLLPAAPGTAAALPPPLLPGSLPSASPLAAPAPGAAAASAGAPSAPPLFSFPSAPAAGSSGLSSVQASFLFGAPPPRPGPVMPASAAAATPSFAASAPSAPLPASVAAASCAAWTEFTWTKFDLLHSLILEALAAPSYAVTSRLKLELERCLPAFANLLDVPPKDAASRAKIQNGTATIRGESFRLNSEFIEMVKCLSDHLNINEEVAATLLHQSTLRQRSYGREVLDGAVELFHEQRSWLLLCLELVFGNVANLDVLASFTSELTRTIVPNAGLAAGATSFVVKVVDSLAITGLQLKSARELEAGLGVGAGAEPLGEAVLVMRVKSLRDERELLGAVLCHITDLCHLTGQEVLALVSQLQKSELADPVTVYLLVATMSSIDVSPEAFARRDLLAPPEATRTSLFNDRSFLTAFNGVVVRDAWPAAALKPALSLQWAVFLKSLRRKNNVVADGFGFSDDFTEVLADKAVKNGAFTILRQYVLRSSLDRKDVPKLLTQKPAQGSGDSLLASQGSFDVPAKVSDQFFELLAWQIDRFVWSIIRQLPVILKKARSREEAAAEFAHLKVQQPLQLTASNVTSMHPPQAAPEPAPAESNQADLTSFMMLISALCSNRPEAGSRFWKAGSEGFGFLRWCAECRTSQSRAAMYDMVASLAAGTENANSAFEFLQARGRQALSTSTRDILSWDALYEALEVNCRELSFGHRLYIHPDEKDLLVAFLRLLRQVVTYSATARAVLLNAQKHRIITLLLSIAGCQVPVDLKAACFDTIAGFSTGTGRTGGEIARKLWFLLEEAQVLKTRQNSGIGVFGASQAPGMQAAGGAASMVKHRSDIETEVQMESAHETYGETIAFVNLVSLLVHSEPRSHIVRVGLGMASESIPDDLGASYRTPGIVPYVKFVLEQILAPVLQRGYVDPEEQWTVVETCLLLVEKCLNTFDLHGFLLEHVALKQKGETGPRTARYDQGGAGPPPDERIVAVAASLLRHPGFLIMCMILSEHPVLDVIITIINAGVHAVNAEPPRSGFTKAVLQCLRVVHRVLQAAPTFLDGLVPFVRKRPEFAAFRIPSSLPGMDRVLLDRTETVVQIARYMQAVGEDEMALVSLRILEILAASPHWRDNKLVAVFAGSEFRDQIIQGYAEKLAGVGEEVAPKIDEPASDSLITLAEGEEAAHFDDSGPLRESISFAILGLLLKNVSPNKKFPTIAHYFLGFPLDGDVPRYELAEVNMLGYRSCLHVILGLLGQGIDEGFAGGEDESPPASDPFVLRNPMHAARCYEILYCLCSNPITSDITMRFLRSRHYVLRQLQVHAPRIASYTGDSLPDLFALLWQRAWLLRSSALELHVAFQKQMRSPVVGLLDVLYGTEIEQEDVEPAAARYEQRKMMVLEMFDLFCVIDREISERCSGSGPPRAVYFRDVDFSATTCEDARGCVVFNIRGAFCTFANKERTLESAGVIGNDRILASARSEIRAWMTYLMAENRRRRLEHAKRELVDAWREIVEVSTAEGLQVVTELRRMSVVAELAETVLARISGAEGAAEAEGLSNTAVFLMARLRQDLQSAPAPGPDSAAEGGKPPAEARMPAERLHGILRLLLQGILRDDGSLMLRGNMYAALLNYLQIVTPAAADPAARLTPYQRAVEAGNTKAVQAAGDQLLELVCRDAADAEDVWRTAAFSVLDVLTRLLRRHQSNSVLRHLSRMNYVRYFVESLRQDDVEIQESFDQEDASQNALFIFQSKMSFLTRLAMHPDGAAKLLDSRLVETLQGCGIITERHQPDANGFDGSMMQDRYQEIISPAVQLCECIVAVLGKDVSRHSLQGVNALLNLLKTDTSLEAR